MKPKQTKIVFIGAGNVATCLAKALCKKAEIVQVYSKTKASAQKLGDVMGCSFTHDLKKINSGADVYIIAVKDDAIEKVVSHLPLKDKLIIHTSGSAGIELLEKTSVNYGVMWPLQTFSKNSVLQKSTPFCIEASSKKAQKLIEELVKEMGGKAYAINSKQRAKLHLAAVFVNNFTNHMYVAANNILKDAYIPFDVLLPLIHETVNKLDKGNPIINQTGPAARGDKKTIKKHEELLKSNSQYLALYKLLTKSIQLSAHAKKF
ncbi:MAG TPA: DUF2520 domain-containing protein [Bacteroidia bacterium]|nr:DUF2520 domain-containing protein [Bacteroidia bacterium]